MKAETFGCLKCVFQWGFTALHYFCDIWWAQSYLQSVTWGLVSGGLDRSWYDETGGWRRIMLQQLCLVISAFGQQPLYLSTSYRFAHLTNQTSQTSGSKCSRTKETDSAIIYYQSLSYFVVKLIIQHMISFSNLMMCFFFIFFHLNSIFLLLSSLTLFNPCEWTMALRQDVISKIQWKK